MGLIGMEQSATSSRSWAFEIALCLLAPFFFLSTLFSVLTPLPILYLHQGISDRKKARLWALLSVPIGCTVTALIAGPTSSLIFFCYGCIPALWMGEVLEKKLSPEFAISTASILLIFSSTLFLFYFFQKSGVTIFSQLESKLGENITLLTKEILEKQAPSLSESSRKEIERLAENPRLILNEAVGLIVTVLILLCTLPVIALIRWNPKNFQQRVGLKRDYIRRWSAPEWMVWPSLFCIAFVIFEVPILTLIASNLMKPLLLIYFFHGISILSFYLDLVRLRGPIRVMIYGVTLFFLGPMIISFGFFDLWFKFRNRTKPDIPTRP